MIKDLRRIIGVGSRSLEFEGRIRDSKILDSEAA